MRLGRPDLSRLDLALAAEWLLEDGLGGSASGTACGALMRPTQGLLVATGPQGRATMLLLRLDERVSGEAGRFELGCHLVAVPPAAGVPAGEGIETPAGERFRARAGWGHCLLEEFRLDPWPVWRWRVGGTLLERSLFTVHGHHAIAVVYRHLAGPPVHLSASPLCVSRGLDELQRERAGVRGAAQGVPGRVHIEFEASPAGDEAPPALTLWHDGTFLPARAWMRAIPYPGSGAAIPDEGGPSPGRAAEDALIPGYVEGLLTPGRPLHLVFAAERGLFKALAAEERLGAPPPRSLAACVALLEDSEGARLARWRRGAAEGADFTARQAAVARGGQAAEAARRRGTLVGEEDGVAMALARALRAGLAWRGGRRTLVATLPGAQERGVDALRALQAFVSLRAFDLTRDVLRGYLEYLDEGLAPERFDPGDGRPLYGDPAPSLWLVSTAERFVRRSGDTSFLTETLHPALEQVMQALRQGTRHGVHADASGLLWSGTGEAAAARADLNALWAHALVAMAQLSQLAGRRESGAFHLAWARAQQRRFAEVFWDEERGCLLEALTPAGPVRGLGPSQLLAAGLSPPLLAPERGRRLVDTVERELFTPFGLRAAPGAARVSPAWLGMFVSASLNARPDDVQGRARARGWIAAPLAAARCAGRVPEAFVVRPDGARAEPAGEPASLLAAAELLRAWIEETDPVDAAHGVSAGA